ncbi:hypothetical protein ACB092_06G206500 [Castanea dentata]
MLSLLLSFIAHISLDLNTGSQLLTDSPSGHNRIQILYIFTLLPIQTSD